MAGLPPLPLPLQGGAAPRTTGMGFSGGEPRRIENGSFLGGFPSAPQGLGAPGAAPPQIGSNPFLSMLFGGLGGNQRFYAPNNNMPQMGGLGALMPLLMGLLSHGGMGNSQQQPQAPGAPPQHPPIQHAPNPGFGGPLHSRFPIGNVEPRGFPGTY